MNIKDKLVSEAERIGFLSVEDIERVFGEPSRKRGRPSTNFNKTEYQRQYMADKRQAEKFGVSVKEYRARKSTGEECK